MLIFENVLAVGIMFLFISITNFVWISKEIRKYMDEDDLEVDQIKLLTKIPLPRLIFFQNLTITSIPMMFAGIFSIIFAFTL